MSQQECSPGEGGADLERFRVDSMPPSYTEIFHSTPPVRSEAGPIVLDVANLSRDAQVALGTLVVLMARR